MGGAYALLNNLNAKRLLQAVQFMILERVELSNFFKKCGQRNCSAGNNAAKFVCFYYYRVPLQANDE